MPYDMPTHIRIQAPAYNNRTRNAEQRETNCMSTFSRGDFVVGQMYPVNANLPYSIQQAIKRTDNDKY